VAVPPAPTGTGLVKAGKLEHVVSPGPYAKKVTVPDGLDPPVRVAVSVRGPPSGDEVGDATPATVGIALAAGADTVVVDVVDVLDVLVDVVEPGLAVVLVLELELVELVDPGRVVLVLLVDDVLDVGRVELVVLELLELLDVVDVVVLELPGVLVLELLDELDDDPVTVTVSAGSPHAVVTAALVRSPEYAARQRYVPGAVGVNGAEVIDPGPLTVRCDVDTGFPEHVASSGPKRVNVIVPVGATPPESIAVSVSCPPTGPPGDAVVVSVGVARRGVNRTASAGSAQSEPAALLLASPL
jgi:hypothetical protein